MIIFTDYEGRSIRLTDERLAHILEHPEMSQSFEVVASVGGITITEESRRYIQQRPEASYVTFVLGETLLAPRQVTRSLSDPQVRLYYGLRRGTTGVISIYASSSR